MPFRLAGAVPGFLRPIAAKAYYSLLDFIDKLRGQDGLLPPRSMRFVGAGDFKAIGLEFKRYFIDLARLQPNDRVLDVGCGIGRMAIPLTDYLSGNGEYWGFDIVKKAIEWCQTNISTRHGRFHFQHSDVHNKYYNPEGRLRSTEYRFPFEDDSFDFVFLTSVFTHILPPDLKHYTSEISRVLKPDGKCLITFFLLNEESTRLVRAGRSTLDFKFELDGCSTVDAGNPESAVAYSEDFVRGLYEGCRLKIVQPIHYGSWCKRDAFLSYQDIVVATKERSS